MGGVPTVGVKVP